MLIQQLIHPSPYLSGTDLSDEAAAVWWKTYLSTAALQPSFTFSRQPFPTAEKRHKAGGCY